MLKSCSVFQIPITWGLSPKKKSQAKDPNFLDMELPEEEDDDDEDFNPEKVTMSLRLL